MWPSGNPHHAYLTTLLHIKSNTNRLCWNCWCCHMPDYWVYLGQTIIAFAITRFFRITRTPRRSFQLSSPVLHNFRVVSVQTLTIGGWLSPGIIPSGGNCGSLPMVNFRWYFLESRYKYSVNAVRDREWFGFKPKARWPHTIKQLSSEGIVTDVHVHPNQVIDVGTDGYCRRSVVVICHCNRRRCVSNSSLRLDTPNKMESKVCDNTSILSRDVGTFNIRYSDMDFFKFTGRGRMLEIFVTQMWYSNKTK